jgi:uncharacterized protein (TIGR02145 family)
MKKIVLLLILSITLFGCGQDAIVEGMTPEEIEVIVAQAETIVESSLTDAIQGDGLVDPVDIAEEIELLEDVVSAEASGSTILMNLADGTELYYFFVDITDDKWFITNETKATQSEALKTKAITQTQTSDIIKPGGNGKALILAPFQFQFDTDLEMISDILNTYGYITHPYINEDADIDKFRGSFMSLYDIVIIYTHGGSYVIDGKKNTGICTGEKVSRTRTKQLKANDQKGWSIGTAGGADGNWYGISQEWLFETTPKDKFFHNTWVFVNGCQTSVWGNVEGSFSKAFFDLGAEAYNGYKRIMHIDEVHRASLAMILNFCSGLSFMDAYEWTTNNFFSEKVLRLSDNEVSYVFDGLQKHASTPFYIVPPDGYQVLPSVNISSIDNITGTTADCNCEVTYEGWRRVTASGVCWSTSQNPTVENAKTTDGADLGPYTSHITGLSPNTTYYVRAYATNSEGTAYGKDQRSFKTQQEQDPGNGSFTDSRDGNVYKTVTIGDQLWMAENLAYLPAVSPSSEGGGMGEYSPPSGDLLRAGPSAAASDTELCYYVYKYSGTNVEYAKATTNYQTYGVLYNWPAALTACPPGWHLPSDEEWTQLENNLIANGYNYDGTTSGNKIAISLASATGWNSSTDTGAIGNTNTAYDAYRNKSGFSALPGGYRDTNGPFNYLGLFGFWWSSTQYDENYARNRILAYHLSTVNRSYNNKARGFSVRCLRD